MTRSIEGAAMLTLGLLTLVCGGAVGAEYLSDVQNERIVYQTQGWGTLGIDTAVRPTDGREPTPLRIKDASYEKGLGHHAPGEILVELNGEYAAFDVDVGVQQQNNGAGSVVFQIFVDDEKRFDSGVMREADAAKPAHVSLEGADTMRLVATDAGDGIMCDCADWANARLTRADKSVAKPTAPPFDIAPFGRIVTWDPARMDGAHSTRIEEFRAEDVYLETPVKPDRDLYPIPLHGGTRGCIGLQWAETRLLKSVGLVFAGEKVPVPEGVTVQCWTGESPWQGQWLPLKGEIRAEGNAWTFMIDLKQNPGFPRTGVDKIRWVFAQAAALPPLKQLAAYTRSNWAVATLRLELEEPTGEKEGRIEVYNGALIPDLAAPEKTGTACPLRDTVRLNVKYSRPRPSKADRTVLRIQMSKGACGIAIEDVLALKRVYVPAIG
ncbi:MAG: NPCBM/NEW2 domain-containing protein, partial [Candidatus Hydrogenedentes bacterium]|nr:NPCBM/NEW2 domain-containing protein [Candidatus Hydrogenedentota bacterium]